MVLHADSRTFKGRIYILPLMVKKTGIFLSGLLMTGAFYFFFFAAHRADLDKNVNEGIIVSHVGVQGTVDIPRNLSDSEIRAIADAGGLIGIGFWDDVVGDLRIESIVSAIQHAVRIGGIDHIGLGSDFDGATHILFDASEIVVLTDALLKAGFTKDEVAKIMGGNQIRFLMENLPQGN